MGTTVTNRRVLLALVGLLLWSQPSQAAIAFVRQATAGPTSATSLTVTITACDTGNILLLSAGAVLAGGSISSVASTGATWTLIKKSNVQRLAELWVGSPCGTGTSVVITWSGSVTNGGANISEWSGLTATTTGTPISNSNASSATITASSITTTSADALLLAVGRHAGTYSSGPTESYTGLTTVGTLLTAYRIVAATGSYFTTWTLTAGSTWESEHAAFVAAVGGASAKRLMLLGVGH